MNRLKAGQLRLFNNDTVFAGQVVLITRLYHDTMAPRVEFILSGKQHNIPEQRMLSDTTFLV